MMALAMTLAAATGQVNIGIVADYAAGFIALINNWLVPVLLAIAFLMFVWGIVNYFIIGASDPSKRNTGGEFLLWSLVGFVAIFSVWGLVNIVGNTFGLSPGGEPPAYPLL